MLVCKDFQQQAIWRIFAIRRLLRVMYNDIVKHRLHVWYICPQCPPLAACPRSVVWILLTVPQWARGSGGRSRDFPSAIRQPARNYLWNQFRVTEYKAAKMEWTLFHSFSFLSLPEHAGRRHLASTLLHLFLLEPTSFLRSPSSHSSTPILHCIIMCVTTLFPARCVSDPVKREMNWKHGMLLTNC